MIVVASSNGRAGITQAMEVLRRGGSALDAVVEGCSHVEANPDDHTVGYSGLPNILGEVELDASIMDGTTRRVGAVAGLKGYTHAARLARKVMEETPHVMVVGDGAARLAAELGFEKREQLTEEAQRIRLERLRLRLSPQELELLESTVDLRKIVSIAADPEKAGGTVNFLAQDAAGNLASAVSTSGWAWKYPGRVGDSPIIGAGNYSDTRYGAAACTGRGELTIRSATAHSVVMGLEYGYSLEDSAVRSLRELQKLEDDFFSRVSMVVLDRTGTPGGFVTAPREGPAEGWGYGFIYMRGDMETPVEAPRTIVHPD